MAAAGAPADEGLFIEVRELRTMVQGLDTTVTNISLSVQQLTQDMSDLHSRHDGGVYGETYANDSGPAIRAKCYESFLEEVRSNLSRLHTGIRTNPSSYGGPRKCTEQRRPTDNFHV